MWERLGGGGRSVLTFGPLLMSSLKFFTPSTMKNVDLERGIREVELAQLTSHRQDLFTHSVHKRAFRGRPYKVGQTLSLGQKLSMQVHCVLTHFGIDVSGV